MENLFVFDSVTDQLINNKINEMTSQIFKFIINPA
jgi:hypothetical protein